MTHAGTVFSPGPSSLCGCPSGPSLIGSSSATSPPSPDGSGGMESHWFGISGDGITLHQATSLSPLRGSRLLRSGSQRCALGYVVPALRAFAPLRRTRRHVGRGAAKECSPTRSAWGQPIVKEREPRSGDRRSRSALQSTGRGRTPEPARTAPAPVPSAARWATLFRRSAPSRPCVEHGGT